MHTLLSAETIIFDLDGTIVDTAPDLCASLNYCLGLKDLSPMKVKTVRHLVGHGAKALLRKGLETHNISGIDTLVEELFPNFIDYYSDHLADHSFVYDGVKDLLTLCKAEGKKLGVCTNKPGFLARPLLDEMNLSQYFDAVLGGDEAKDKKPSGAHIVETIELAGGSSENALMIGDSEIDYYAAIDVKIPVILIRHGYSKVPLETLQSDLLIDNFTPLIS